MIDWQTWLRDIAGREPAALVSIVASEGSTPRGVGTRMVVTSVRQFGSIGGGKLEFCAIEQARALLGHATGTWRVQDYPLGPLLGQCCGGRVRLLLEHIDADRLEWLGDAAEGCVLFSTLLPDRVERHVSKEAVPVSHAPPPARPEAGFRFAEILGQYQRPVWLFGAGHVGQAIARHAENLPLRLAWFDTRPVFESITGVMIVPETGLEQCIAEAPDDAAILILTHDHGLDYRLTKAALERDATAYVGLIGSATKRARFHGRLDREGIGPERREQLTCPIGLPHIRGREPDVIAVSTIAQLLQLTPP
jgi:xanthine dehydrogenase accessory factor